MKLSSTNYTHERKPNRIFSFGGFSGGTYISIILYRTYSCVGLLTPSRKRKCARLRRQNLQPKYEYQHHNIIDLLFSADGLSQK